MKIRVVGRGESLCVSALGCGRARTTCGWIFRWSRRRKDRGERMRGGNRDGLGPYETQDWMADGFGRWIALDALIAVVPIRELRNWVAAAEKRVVVGL